MKKHLTILFILITAILAVTSCGDDGYSDPYNGHETPNMDKYVTMPFSITASINSMDDVNGGKKVFSAGDAIKITNPYILAEPSVLAMESGEGKATASFSGELKVLISATLTPGDTRLSAALLNTNDSIYNNGDPLMEIFEVSSAEEGLQKYGSWSCEDFAYHASEVTITLTQKTAILYFDIPVRDTKALISIGNIFYRKYLKGNEIYAVPNGTSVSIPLFDINEAIDMNGQGKARFTIKVGGSEDFLPKEFSISTTQKVFFSKGNLQYRPYDGKWRFAPYQYHRCFAEHTNVGDNYSEWMGEDCWIEHFSWGSWLEGANINETSPQITISNMPIDKNLNLSGNCAIGPGWRVLTIDEWLYLLNERSGADRKKGGVEIDGVLGYLLLPDDWKTPEGVKDFIYDFAETEMKAYSADEWVKMESAGAVFLPASGMRTGPHVQLTGMGACWSCTAADFEKARAFYFNRIMLAENQSPPTVGFGIRLVKGKD